MSSAIDIDRFYIDDMSENSSSLQIDASLGYILEEIRIRSGLERFKQTIIVINLRPFVPLFFDTRRTTTDDQWSIAYTLIDKLLKNDREQEGSSQSPLKFRMPQPPLYLLQNMSNYSWFLRWGSQEGCQKSVVMLVLSQCRITAPETGVCVWRPNSNSISQLPHTAN